MDLTCFNWVQIVKKSDLPSNAKYVALYLGTFMNAEHDVAWPSMARISHETGLTKTTARKWLDYLNEAGWLVKSSGSRIVSTAGGSQKNNEYAIRIPESFLRRVNDCLPSAKGGQPLDKGGLAVDQRGVNGCSKGGQPLTPNNNTITKNNNVNNNKRFSGIDLSNIDDSISQHIAIEFISHRKAMRAPLTQHAFDLAMGTAIKACEIGMTPDQAINETISSGWKGINIKWLENKSISNARPREKTYEEIRDNLTRGNTYEQLD